ncbi:GumC family protein, partial [Bosea sp. TWI1241]|uniref:GumC family protein n=1 Tax=Bosea sp. TWI1241 TaxID=3148904 RepID=UPI003207AB51
MFTTETVPDEADRSAAGQARPAGGGPPFSLLADPAWLVATLWRRKGLVLLCGLLGALFAAGASLLLPARYVSTAQLLIDPRDLRVLQTEVAPNALGGDASAITAYLESQARVIASDSIKARVAEQEKLDRDPEFGGDSGPGLFGGLFGGDAAGRSREARLYTLAQLDKAVQVRRGERTFVIDIAVTTRDPAKSARIANALANAYLEDQAAVRDAAARRATDALTGRLEELRGRLRGAEDKVERFKEANRLIGAGGKPVGEEQLSLSNAQLVAAQARVAETKARVDEITRTRASSLEAGAIPEAVASNTMTALRAQLGAALSREADLSASLGARHPALAAAQAQVRDARRQIADELARIARAARSDYDRARDAERQLSGSVTRLTDGQVAASRASVELRELEREVESSRSVYEGFLRRARETGELAGIDTTNARVISQAMPALQRSGTSRRTLVLAGGVVGLGLGGALALALGLAAAARPARRDEERPEAEDTVAEAATPPMPAAPVAAPAAADV